MLGSATQGTRSWRQWRTSFLAVLVIFLSFVLSPIIFLHAGPLKKDAFNVKSAIALVLLAIGLSSVTGALLSRFYDRGRCNCLERTFFFAGTWLLNPVAMALIGINVKQADLLLMWSAFPLGVVVLVATARLPILQGDPTWAEMVCRPQCFLVWVCSRLICVVLPTLLYSFQIALYSPLLGPSADSESKGKSMSVVGGCMLITLKFFLICGQLNARPSQALVLFLLLSADWTSIIHLLELINDDVEFAILVLHFLGAGLIEWRDSFKELRPCSRRGQQSSTPDSDSDDDAHPFFLGSYHAAILKVLGLATEGGAQRQFLCATRRALVVSAPPILAGGELEETSLRRITPQPTSVVAASSGASGNASLSTPLTPEHQLESGGGGGPAPLQIGPEESCSICLTKFQSGDDMRPLPKCAHLFHAECLESWARQKREGTACPVCRRPALIRKPLEGALAISSLGAAPPSVSTRASSHSSRNSNSSSSGSSGPSSASRGERIGRRGADLQASLGISAVLAEATLEVTDGDVNLAANLVMEHARLVQVFASSRRRSRSVSAEARELADAIARSENPFLAGYEPMLASQLAFLTQQRRIEVRRAWAVLGHTQQWNMLRVVMEHTSELHLARTA